jgi:hypothetical protein
MMPIMMTITHTAYSTPCGPAFQSKGRDTPCNSTSDRHTVHAAPCHSTSRLYPAPAAQHQPLRSLSQHLMPSDPALRTVPRAYHQMANASKRNGVRAEGGAARKRSCRCQEPLSRRPQHLSLPLPRRHRHHWSPPPPHPLRRTSEQASWHCRRPFASV